MKKIAFIILSSVMMNSCTDMNLIPESNLSPENFFKSEEDATAAVYGTYSVFTDNDIYNQFWEVLQSQGTDDCEWSGGRTTTNLDKNALDKSEYDGNTNLVYSVWIKHYVAVNRSNFAIENISNMGSEQIRDDVRKRLIGEAKFLRALAYFNLVRIYGGVPLVLKQTTSLDGLEVPRNTVDECYEQIISDLQEAKSVLPAIGQLPEGYLGRATKGSASAMLAKVYLTREDYQNVVKETSEVMQMGYKLWKNYADNFDVAHENNEESILEFQFLGDVDNAGFNPGLATSGLAFDSRGLMLPGAGVGYEGVVHNWLYNAFVNSIDKDGYTDIRMFSTMIFNDLDASIHLRNDAGGNPVRLEGPGGYKWEELYPAKNGKEGFATVSNPLAHSFKAGIRKGIDCSMPTQTEADGTPKLVGVGAGVKEYVYNQPRAHGVNWRYIRYADVLMMYAEAVVSGGTQASNMTPLQAVNKVRGRANMSELPSVTMADIQNERILEFALEGHRFYDLLRWGKLASRFTELQESDPNFKKFISADDFKGFVTNKHEWLPIPINEVNSNPYITENNPGY